MYFTLNVKQIYMDISVLMAIKKKPIVMLPNSFFPFLLLPDKLHRSF
jgi:hypothetical protein